MSDTPVVGLDPMQLGALVHQYEEQITTLKAKIRQLEQAHERAAHERDLWRAIAVRLLATATGLDTATVFTQFPTPPIEVTDQISADSVISNALVTWWVDLSSSVTNASGKHPMQPVYLDNTGCVRFKPNKIIDWLFNTRKLDLNQIVGMGFPQEDYEQLYQLLHYSISGYHELSRVSDESAIQASRARAHVLAVHGLKDE